MITESVNPSKKSYPATVDGTNLTAEPLTQTLHFAQCDFHRHELVNHVLHLQIKTDLHFFNMVFKQINAVLQGFLFNALIPCKYA